MQGCRRTEVERAGTSPSRTGSGHRRAISHAAAPTRPLSTRRVAASPTVPPGRLPAQAPCHLPHHGRPGAPLTPPPHCDPSPPDKPAKGLHCDRDRPARSTRAAMPQAIAKKLAGRTATSAPGWPASTIPTKTRAVTARSARPAASRSPGPLLQSSARPPSRPPSSREVARAGGHRDARPTLQRTSSRNTLQTRPVRGRPWKTDGYTDRPGDPDAVRYTSVDTATSRSKTGLTARCWTRSTARRCRQPPWAPR
jgi:hypothetical protein